MTASRYTFVRNAGSRYGELHRERSGFVKFVTRAYLNSEGWLVSGDDSWLRPGSFRMQTVDPPVLRVPVTVLDRVIADAMQLARKLLGERYHAHPPVNPREPVTTSERDTRHHDHQDSI